MKQNLERIELIFGVDYMDKVKNLKEVNQKDYNRVFMNKDQKYNN